MATIAQRTVTDACVFHDWPGTAALGPYLTDGWKEILVRPGHKAGPYQFAQWLYQNPDGAKLARAYPDTGPAGSDRSLLLEQTSGDRLVLAYDTGLLATAVGNPNIAHTVARAANDWTIAEWIEQDDRLYGLVLIANVLPDRAAEEIRRVGAHPKMVGIAMGANGLSLPFGHPIYDPIHAAAVQLGLPIVIQSNSDASVDSATPPVAGGMPATYSEYRAMSMHTHMAHLASLIVQGVFERYPTLQVLLVGGGAAWIPGYLWRLDALYKSGAHEVPWLKRLPSEYLVDHCRTTTYSLEVPADPSQLISLVGTIDGFDRVLMYASGYPNSDALTPDAAAARLPESWHERVFKQNAEEFFRWP